MKRAKVGQVVAGIILAVSVSVGLGGCNRESIQESPTQAVPSQTKENEVQQLTEENIGCSARKI